MDLFPDNSSYRSRRMRLKLGGQLDYAVVQRILRVASGPRVKLASYKSVLNPLWFILLTVLRR